MAILLYISLILLLYVEILYDGHFSDPHNKKSNYLLTLIFLFSGTLGLLVGNFLSIATYFFLRVGLFDLSYGKMFRTGYFYLGGNWTDKLQEKFPKKLRITFWVFSLLLSIIINFKIYEYIL